MTCPRCGGPVAVGAGGLLLHDNSGGWYAGMQMDCNGEFDTRPVHRCDASVHEWRPYFDDLGRLAGQLCIRCAARNVTLHTEVLS